MRRIVKETIIFGLFAVAVLYMGFPNLLPDFIPWVGQLDNGVAFTIILGTLRHYGIDFTGLYGSPRKQKQLPDG